jgi:hypothetical protein
MKTYEKIMQQLEKNNNVLLYKEELYSHYKNLKDKYINVIYISTPKKGKTAFEQIVKQITDTNPKNKTISKLLEEIIENTKTKKLYLCIDNFEQLSKRELQHYKELEQQTNIVLIVNIMDDKEFIDDEFLDKFILLNEYEFKNNRSKSISLNYVVLLLLSFLIFVLFIRIQLSKLRYLVSGLWFTLLMYRTFYYISK